MEWNGGKMDQTGLRTLSYQGGKHDAEAARETGAGGVA